MWEIRLVRVRTTGPSAARAATLLPLLLVAVACTTTGATLSPSPEPSGVASEGCNRAAAGSLTHLAIDVAGELRTVRVHLPTSQGSSGPYPLVVAVHGLGDTADDMERMTGLSDEADVEGLVVVYPQGAGDPPDWDLVGSTDVMFLQSTVETALARFCIDTTRVFAAGFFTGGSLVARLGCEDANRVAAIATVAGLYSDAFGGACTSRRPIPVVTFHGLRDEVVQYDGGEVAGTDEGALDGAATVPVEEWATAWASHNGCDPQPQELPAVGDAAPLLWTNCDAPVEVLRVANGHHDWPGGDNDCGEACPPSDFSATQLMLEFFEAHPLEGH
jgi:polyhydroxybutyrate depolymerase